MGVTAMVLEDIRPSISPSIHLKNTEVTATDRIEENLYTIQASSQLLLTLINNLLDVRKIDAGMMDDESFTLECLDLQVVIKQCVDTLKPLASLSDVRLNVAAEVSENVTSTQTAYHDKGWLVMGGTLLVQQVLINIVGNAIGH